jgi:acyl-coenzyme A synthetase/AMP-(fatty) acid ligase
MALNRSLLPVAILGAALAGTSLPAAQAQQPKSPSPPQQQPQQQMVSDQEIETFAAAATEVRLLNKQWAPKLDAAQKESPEAAQSVRNQALQEMAQAVERKGMSVERYEQIFTVARNDPEVRRKIVEKMPKDD